MYRYFSAGAVRLLVEHNMLLTWTMWPEVLVVFLDVPLLPVTIHPNAMAAGSVASSTSAFWCYDIP